MDLKKMILMLSSDNDGEVVAAARAIGRLLKKEGKDWHWLAEQIGSARPKIVANRRMPWEPTTPWNGHADARRQPVAALVKFLLDNENLLTKEQFRFARGIRTKVWEDLTSKQKNYLTGLYGIVQRKRRE